MSTPTPIAPSTRLVPSDALRQAHDIPAGKHIVGHRLVVEGLYLAKPPLRDAAGAAEKRKVKYHEEFVITPHEHRVHGQGALGHILSLNILAARLLEKDPEFRSVSTHEVVKHENIYEDAPVAPAAPAAETKD